MASAGDLPWQKLRPGFGMAWAASLLFAFLGMPSAGSETEAVAVSGSAALIRGLDTITGERQDFEVAVGETVVFGRLRISVEDCRYLPENPATHSYASMRITEQPAGTVVFHAWMIASSPALSAMEHTRYDVWLIHCVPRQSE